jgi:hypothetical protein
MPDGFADPGVARPRLAGFDIEREVGLLFAAPDAGLEAHPLILAAKQVCSTASDAE